MDIKLGFGHLKYVSCVLRVYVYDGRQIKECIIYTFSCEGPVGVVRVDQEFVKVRLLLLYEGRIAYHPSHKGDRDATFRCSSRARTCRSVICTSPRAM